MHDYYAARAPEYDRLKPERQSDLLAIRQWLPTVFRSKSLLEVACGTGYWTQYLAPAAERVLAFDASPETLRIAQARVAAGEVEFVIGDAYQLPASARGFQSAFAGFWFSHIPKHRIREFLTGPHTALVPGANVVFLDNRYVEGSSTPMSGNISGPLSIPSLRPSKLSRQLGPSWSAFGGTPEAFEQPADDVASLGTQLGWRAPGA